MKKLVLLSVAVLLITGCTLPEQRRTLSFPGIGRSERQAMQKNTVQTIAQKSTQKIVLEPNKACNEDDVWTPVCGVKRKNDCTGPDCQFARQTFSNCKIAIQQAMHPLYEGACLPQTNGNKEHDRLEQLRFLLETRTREPAGEIIIAQESGGYIRGDFMEASMSFYAKRENGQWKILEYGSGVICETLKRLNVPESLQSDCLEEDYL